MVDKYTLADRVREYLDSLDIHYLEEDNIFNFGTLFSDSNLKIVDIFMDCQNDGKIICHTISPINASPEHFQSTETFISLANFGMIMGCFELDRKDGEVRFRTCLPAGGNTVEIENIAMMFKTNIATFHRYINGLLAVCLCGSDPQREIDRIENGMD